MKKRKRRKRCTLGAWFLLAVLIAAAAGVFPFLSEAVRRVQYPVKLQGMVRETAAQFDLDPALIAAVICTESHYDERALSSVGAMGLMQIMPETGEWIAGKLDRQFETNDLYDPRCNMEMGAWYLRFLLERYGGDITSAVAAYHAGQGRVDAWLQDPACSADGKTLQKAATDSTQHYLKKVFRAYENYKILYEDR